MSLGTKAREAVFWTAGFSLFRDLLQFVQTLVLVRLLAPEAYGRFGLVTSVVTFFTVVSFREFLQHTLQVRDDRDLHYQDHFTAGLAIQVAMCALVNLTAVGLRWTSTYAPVAPMLHVMSVLFLLDLPCEFRVKMLERELQWKRLRTLNAAGIVIYAVASIAMAAAGAGAWALLVPTLFVTVPFIYDLFVTAGWRPTWHWSRKGYEPAARFGFTRVSGASLATASQLCENAVLARAVGFVALGVFGRAGGLAQMSCLKVGTILMQALYPVLTKIAPGSERYRQVAALVLRSVAWVAVPLGVIVAVLGRPVVNVLYGAKWVEVIPLVASAMAMGVALSLSQAAYFVLLAHQRQRRCLVVDAVRLGGTLLLLAVLLPRGVSAYLQGLAVLHACTFTIVARWLRQDRAITLPGLVSAIAPPLAGSAAGIALCEIARRSAGIAVEGFWSGLAYGSVFAAVYVLALRLLFESQLRELVACLPQSGRLNKVLGFRPSAAVPVEVA